MRRLSWNLGASTSWNPLGLSRPVMGLLYLYLMTKTWLLHTQKVIFWYKNLILSYFLLFTFLHISFNTRFNITFISTAWCLWSALRLLRCKTFNAYVHFVPVLSSGRSQSALFNPLKPELNPICYLLALLAHHFLHVRVKSLTIRLLMSYIYGAPILDVSRSHTTTQHSR